MIGYLAACLDAGLTETQFWDSTLDELQRALDSWHRREQRKAAMDYRLADLIGTSVARLIASGNTMPSLSEAYPSLFEDAAKTERDNLTIARFMEYAAAHNQKFKGATNHE